MPMRSFRSTDNTDRQLEELCAAGFGNATQVILTAIDRMYQQEIPTVTTTTTHKYNLSSNMSHRINFDQMIERRLADVQAAYGDEVGDWHLYFDLDELDVDDEAEAAARIESIWPAVKATVYVEPEMLGDVATDADARRMVELLTERGYDAQLGSALHSAAVPADVWGECLDIISQEKYAA